MIGASVPPLAIEYYRSAPPQHITPASEKPPESANLQHGNTGERGTEQVPLIVKVVPGEPTPQAEAREKQKDENERRVADYTKWLFFATLFLGAVTGGLALVAFFQMRDSRDSIDASVRLANAAETTTRHIERPYLAVASMDGAYIYQPRNAMRGLLGREDVDADKTPNTFRFTCTFHNYGRMPAIVERTYFDMFMWEIEAGTGKIISEPPETPAYEETGGIREYKVVGQGEDSQSYTRIITHEAIRENQGFFARKWPLVFGYIRYRDLSGRRFQCGFGFNFLGAISFGIHTRQYNYDRELEPADDEAPVRPTPDHDREPELGL